MTVEQVHGGGAIFRSVIPPVLGHCEVAELIHGWLEARVSAWV